MMQGMTSGEVDEILASGAPKPTLPIRSSIDGVVVRLNKVLGESVADDEPLFEIHDLSHPWAKTFLSEREAAKLRIGTPARVRLLSDPSFVAEGRVVQSARMLGVENRTMAAWIEFASQSDRPLHRNLLARVSATIGQPEATLAVPIPAIVSEGTRKYVFIQKEGELLERRSVELGRSDDRFVEVRAGLAVGEKVAVQGTAELQTTYASVR
jgi:RND family efflux transporter MFP subunit